MKLEQMLIGVMTATLCAAGIVKRAWFLSETKKGRSLVRRLGVARAKAVTLAFFSVGLLFGLALACGILNPIRW